MRENRLVVTAFIALSFLLLGQVRSLQGESNEFSLWRDHFETKDSGKGAWTFAWNLPSIRHGDRHPALSEERFFFAFDRWDEEDVFETRAGKPRFGAGSHFAHGGDKWGPPGKSRRNFEEDCFDSVEELPPAVPEPSTWALGLVSLAVILWFKRKGAFQALLSLDGLHRAGVGATKTKSK